MTISEAKRITRMNEWRQLIHERQQMRTPLPEITSTGEIEQPFR